jgi:hypothetical protein
MTNTIRLIDPVQSPPASTPAQPQFAGLELAVAAIGVSVVTSVLQGVASWFGRTAMRAYEDRQEALRQKIEEHGSAINSCESTSHAQISKLSEDLHREIRGLEREIADLKVDSLTRFVERGEHLRSTLVIHAAVDKISDQIRELAIKVGVDRAES